MSKAWRQEHPFCRHCWGISFSTYRTLWLCDDHIIDAAGRGIGKSLVSYITRGPQVRVYTKQQVLRSGLPKHLIRTIHPELHQQIKSFFMEAFLNLCPCRCTT